MIFGKRRLTIPLAVCEEAKLSVGDRVRARADGPGRVVMERIEAPASIFDGAGEAADTDSSTDP